MIQKWKHLIETGAFGVCAYLGSKMGIATSRIRLFFIYITFIALGSPILIYMSLAFVINIRNYMRNKLHPIKELFQ
ncbi:MAG: PspC family transcriptional regulator [Chitinophagales bacterium]